MSWLAPLSKALVQAKVAIREAAKKIKKMPGHYGLPPPPSSFMAPWTYFLVLKYPDNFFFKISSPRFFGPKEPYFLENILFFCGSNKCGNYEPLVGGWTLVFRPLKTSICSCFFLLGSWLERVAWYRKCNGRGYFSSVRNWSIQK